MLWRSQRRLKSEHPGRLHGRPLADLRSFGVEGPLRALCVGCCSLEVCLLPAPPCAPAFGEAVQTLTNVRPISQFRLELSANDRIGIAVAVLLPYARSRNMSHCGRCEYRTGFLKLTAAGPSGPLVRMVGIPLRKRTVLQNSLRTRSLAVVCLTVGKASRSQTIRKIMSGFRMIPTGSRNFCRFDDSLPDRHRNICQSLRPVFEGHICTGFIFCSFYQNSWQRPPMRLYDFKRLRRLEEENRDLPNVTMCSWCQRVQSSQIADGNYISAETYYAEGGRSEVRLSHGICEDCLETTLDPLPLSED